MIILSIPYLDTKFVKTAISKNSFELYELRADYLKSLSEFDKNLIGQNTIITVREKNEGGINSFTEFEKLNLYRYSIKNNALIDCELTFYQKHRFELSNKNIILSYHCFSSEIDMPKIEKILSYSSKVKYVKLAVKIDSWENLEKITRKIADYKNVIFISLGKTGIVSRLLYKKIGSAATYIGLDGKTTAKGQLSLSQLWFNPNNVDVKTLIGGLLGGEQVIGSRGLKFYNDYFNSHNINAVYLPFPANSTEDFFKWYKSYPHYGLSVTMPFKEKIAREVKGEAGIYNLFVNNRLYNTDKIAMEKAKTFLKIKHSSQVLIYGSGAMAKLALQVFSDCETFIFARDMKKAENLSETFDSNLDLPRYVDLFVNCTPVGLDENFFRGKGLKFSSVIDLPYSIGKDTSLITYAKKNGISFVDGNTFWRWQAEKQLELFLQNITLQ